MAATGGTNLPRVGGYNQAVILDAIRVRGQITRIELAELTGLTNQTVSNVVRRLLDGGLVSETGHAPSSGGKRRTLLSPRADGAYAIGVHLDRDAGQVVLVDLAGGTVAGRRFSVRAPDEPSAVVEQAARTARRLITRSGVDPKRLLGAGIAAPGPIDGTAGEVVSPPNLSGWGRVPLLSMFGTALDMPVALDKDATAAAIGERWIGGRERAGSFLFLYFGAGIGGGIVLNDTVLHGDSGNAGEFGHMAVEPGDRICGCGSTRCVGPYCSPRALVEEVFHRHGETAAARIGLTGAAESLSTDWKRLRQAAGRGDPAADDVARRAARLLGQAARGAVALLDVSRVVLGGEGLRGLESLMCEEIDAAVNGTSIARALDSVAVETSVIGDTAGAVGAAALILHGHYAPGLRLLTT